MSGRVSGQLWAALLFSGCASGGGSSSDSTSEIGGGAAAGNAGSGSGGAPGGRTGVGGSLLVVGVVTPEGGATSACAGELTSAELVPLDLMLMLDTSLSMVEVTGNGTQKWDAIRSALDGFFSDPGSAGLGIGIQYFPLQKTGVPESCTTDAECGLGGPCFTRICAGALTVIPCSTDAECRPSLIQDLGPCVPFGECENDPGFICELDAGWPCGVDPATRRDLGACLPARPSFCLGKTSCSAPEYGIPAVPFSELPQARARLAASIGAQSPAGDTPTAPALVGALNQARNRAVAHPGHAVAVVLATDGLPTQCQGPGVTSSDQAIAEVASLASDGSRGTPGIPTFVIGVFGPGDPAEASANLNRIARAGNTARAFIVDTSGNVTQQFNDALDAIRGARLTCEFQIPEPAAGQNLNYFQVNVEFRNRATETQLFYVGDEASCDPISGGWYYDTDPSAREPARIIVCPSNCSEFQSAAEASVQIELGCDTIVR